MCKNNKTTYRRQSSDNRLKEGCLDPVEIQKSRTAKLFDCKIGEVTDDMIRSARSYIFSEICDSDPEMIKKLVQDDLARAKRRLNKS